jgi:hypothetical protein
VYYVIATGAPGCEAASEFRGVGLDGARCGGTAMLRLGERSR